MELLDEAEGRTSSATAAAANSFCLNVMEDQHRHSDIQQQEASGPQARSCAVGAQQTGAMEMGVRVGFKGC